MTFESTRSFVRDCNLAASEDDLADILSDATSELGFEHFALGHHVDFRRHPVDAIWITSYDDGWVEESTTLGYHLEDPILIASTRTAVGFKWSDVSSLISLTDRQQAILEKGAQYGLSEGFTVPVHIPGEHWGTCSFGAKSMAQVTEDDLRAAQLIGTFAFESARRFLKARSRRGSVQAIPLLTQRQADCVTLVAQGKTDWEAAQILGLSQDTVHQHVETARKRYGVAKRTQLVVRAIYDGQISFSAAIN